MPYEKSDNTTNVVRPTLAKIQQKKKDTPQHRKYVQKKVEQEQLRRLSQDPYQAQIGQGRNYSTVEQKHRETASQRRGEIEQMHHDDQRAAETMHMAFAPFLLSNWVGAATTNNAHGLSGRLNYVFDPKNRGIFEQETSLPDSHPGIALGNLAFDVTSPFLIKNTASLLPKVGFQQGGLRVGNYVYRAPRYQLNMGVPVPERVAVNDVTENFLKFVGGDGKPTQAAIPRTQAQIQMYGMLKANGVDMSKISIEDINKALQLRENQLIQSGRQFSYQQPVTSNSQLIWSIDDGLKTGYIDLRMPYQVNDRGFSPTLWENYINNPRNHGLRIGMVENLSQTQASQYPMIYRGLQERLTNSAINVAKEQGYEGVVSGEALLSPERTVSMYPKYKDKLLLSEDGIYHWENHNPGLQEQLGPVYMLKQPTYPTEIKSQIFDPKIIDSNGHMRITWGKGSTMFNGIALALVLTNSFGNSN